MYYVEAQTWPYWPDSVTVRIEASSWKDTGRMVARRYVPQFNCKMIPTYRDDLGAIVSGAAGFGVARWLKCTACGGEVLAYPANYCPACGAKVIAQ